ncbi:hypothetical protein IJG91_00675 [Candidatus Saccharibacteria bacterium]|nr:hypothetical protein [Candidatus Saccharibacteria bacterium]
MAKIQVTDDADAKKKTLAKKTTAKRSTRKVSVDTTSVTPKKIKRIKVEKAEKKSPKKSTKTKQPVRVEKSESKKTEVAVKKIKKTATKVSIQPSNEVKKKSSTKIKHTASAVSSNATHNILQKSTTLSRRYVKRPENELAKDTRKSDNKKPAESATPITSNVFSEPATKEDSENEVKISINEPSANAKTEKSKKAQAKAERQALKVAKAQAKLAEKRARAEAELARKAQAKAEKIAAIKAARAQKDAAIRAAKEARLARKHAKTAMPALKGSKTSTNKALHSAMQSVATMDTTDTPKEMHHEFRKKRKGGRIALAMLCSAVTVAALVAFVHFNMPDISVKVAAIQTGIDASYPSIIPRGYTLSNVSSDKDGQITMVFKNSDEDNFTLTEEKSTWDSNALLNNYVKKSMSSKYSTMREQGITIYSEGDSAVWVNGGILFKVKASGKYLTKEQIRNLATSV